MVAAAGAAAAVAAAAAADGAATGKPENSEKSSIRRGETSPVGVSARDEVRGRGVVGLPTGAARATGARRATVGRVSPEVPEGEGRVRAGGAADPEWRRWRWAR